MNNETALKYLKINVYLYEILKNRSEIFYLLMKELEIDVCESDDCEIEHGVILDNENDEDIYFCFDVFVVGKGCQEFTVGGKKLLKFFFEDKNLQLVLV